MEGEQAPVSWAGRRLRIINTATAERMPKRGLRSLGWIRSGSLSHEKSWSEAGRKWCSILGCTFTNSDRWLGDSSPKVLLYARICARVRKIRKGQSYTPLREDFRSAYREALGRRILGDDRTCPVNA